MSGAARMASASAETYVGEVAPLPRLSDVRAGTRLAGYELDEIVGRGGMGVVYRARHVHLDRIVALKLLNPDLSGDGAFRDRFLRESRVAASLHHPAVVGIYDAGEADGLLYIAMQYVEGRDLAAVLADDGALAPERALRALDQIAGGLDAAHARGLVHRDVKPGNVLVSGERCYLGDFGLTRHVASTSGVTSHGSLVGTLDYMAPEQIEGTVVDRRTDVYALGCVLYQMLTGKVPFQKDSQVSLIYAHLRESPRPPSRARPGLPAAIDAVVEKALAKVKEDRYGSCGELAAAAAAAVAASEREPAARLAAPSSVRDVLVAEPDAALRAMIRGTFGRAGYAVREAVDGAAASAAVEQRRPDLLVVATALAADLAPGFRAAAGPASRVVVVGERGAAARAADEAGADASITKPFSSLQLLMTADELLDDGRGDTPSFVAINELR